MVRRLPGGEPQRPLLPGPLQWRDRRHLLGHVVHPDRRAHWRALFLQEGGDEDQTQELLTGPLMAGSETVPLLNISLT